MKVQDLISSSGLTMKEISKRFGIPYRTIQDWNAGRRTPPEYVLRLLAAALEKE